MALTPEEIAEGLAAEGVDVSSHRGDVTAEELVSEMYDAFHPLFLGTEETEHAESLLRGRPRRGRTRTHVTAKHGTATALKRLGFYHGRIDGDFSARAIALVRSARARHAAFVTSGSA